MSVSQSKPTLFEQIEQSILGVEDPLPGIKLWADQACVMDVRSALSGSDLYASYVYWASKSGAPVCTERKFLVTLGNEGVPKIIRNGRRVWLGIVIRPEWRGELLDGQGAGMRINRSAGGVWKDSIEQSVYDWAADRCEVDTEQAAVAEEWADSLYADYLKWSDSRIGRVAFGIAVIKLDGVYCHPRQPCKIGSKVVQRTKYSGIKLKVRPINDRPREMPKQASKEPDWNELVRTSAPAPAPAAHIPSSEGGKPFDFDDYSDL